MSVLFKCVLPLNYQPFNTKNLTLLLNKSFGAPSIVVPYRTTIIVKRRFPVQLYKEGNKPKLRKRNFYYDFVEDTNVKPEPAINVVLTTYVKGIGNDGDVVSMKMSAAYHKLIIPGFANFATPEMLEYSRKLKKDESVTQKQISPSVEVCMRYLQRMNLVVVMNKETEWTIEPWHIRASFRKAGIHILSEESIQLPAKPIKGPDMNLQGKEFYVTVTINKKDKVKVRCRIHHWSTAPSDRLPFQQEPWLIPAEPVFPEDDPKNTNDTSEIKSS